MSRAALSVLRLSLPHCVVTWLCLGRVDLHCGVWKRGEGSFCTREVGARGACVWLRLWGCGEGCVSASDVTVRLLLAMGELVLFGFHFFKETVC